jgi:hypothetical protein
MTEADDEIDINLRPLESIGRRLIIVATLCRRLFLESAAMREDLDEDVKSERFDLLEWLKAQSLAADLTQEEADLMSAFVGAIDQDSKDLVTWNAEVLRTIGWFLSIVEDIPEVSKPTDLSPILNLVPSPWDETASFLSALRSRTVEDTEYERERAEIWLWRAEIEGDRRALRGCDLAELEADLREVVEESIRAHYLPEEAKRDFTIDGRSFGDLDAETNDFIGGIAAARLHALNWICGFGTTWGDVPLDVE